MAFLVFERVLRHGGPVLCPTGEHFSLAGHNLIYHAWEQRGRPTEAGWHVDADELIRLLLGDRHSREPRRLVIGFDPRARRRIGLVELLDVYAYTFSGTQAYEGDASWTPLMLRLRDVLYIEYPRDISSEEKTQTLARIPERNDEPESIEFLYLNGSDQSWNWGKNGMTNAAFIQGAARDYFRQYF